MTTFSIITVCRNAETTLASALQSLAAQTFQDWEWIMVDGESTDGTLRLSKILEGRGVRQQIITEPDKGIYEAMNKGVRASQGAYLYFLNADDVLHDERVLEEVALELQRANTPDVLYGDIEVRMSGERGSIYHSPPPDGALQEMVCGCLPHQGCFSRKYLFTDVVGMFDEKYRTAGDYAWMMRALSTPNVQIHHMDRVIARYSADGASSNLERSLPESFDILNENKAFQDAVGRERLLKAYQAQVLALRLELGRMRECSTKLAENLQRTKERLAEANQKRDRMRKKLDASKTSAQKSWLPKWMRRGS